MRWFFPAVLLTALALLPGVTSANPQQAFEPAYDIVSLSPNTAGAHGTITQHISVPASDHVIGNVKFTLPAGWDIANVQSVDDSPVVGTGLLRVDVDQTDFGGPPCDSIMETYPLTVVDSGSNLNDPPELETTWSVQGYPFQAFPFTVKNIAGTQILESLMFQNPPNVCAMTTFDLTFQGVSTDNPSTPEAEAGRNVLTNPTAAGLYTWSIEFKSKPPSAPDAHTAVRCDQVGVGGQTPTDTDGDGIANTCDNCPTISNANQLNWDEDSTGDACDTDIDGDGRANASDQCPFTPLGFTVDVNGCSQSQVDQDLDGKCDPGKSSPSWCTGSDNCPTAYNPTQANVVHPATTPGDACEDPDGDFWPDNQDNCPDTYNPFQDNSDLDGRGDLCDNCPTVTNQDQLNIDNDAFGDACDAGDFDGDFFSDRVEYFAGTDRGAKCPINQTHNAWPADINNNGFSDITDLTFLTGAFGRPVPPALPRYNIAPDPPDGFVDITDIARLVAFFGRPCPP